MSLPINLVFNEDRLIKIAGLIEGSFEPESLTLRAVRDFAGYSKGQFAGQVPIGDFRLAESTKLLTQSTEVIGQLNTVMGLQVLSLGVNVVGFAMVLYKLEKMDKKLDKIIEMIEGIKEEDVNKHVDRLKSILRTLENSSHYNLKEKDPDYKNQLVIAKSEISYLKEYFIRHTDSHVHNHNFKDYMIFLSMCYLADYKIDSNMNQISLARKNLLDLKKIIITNSPIHLDLYPDNIKDIRYYNYLKDSVDGYLYDIDNEYLKLNEVKIKDSNIIELDIEESKEVYNLLNEKLSF